MQISWESFWLMGKMGSNWPVGAHTPRYFSVVFSISETLQQMLSLKWWSNMIFYNLLIVKHKKYVPRRIWLSRNTVWFSRHIDMFTLGNTLILSQTSNMRARDNLSSWYFYMSRVLKINMYDFTRITGIYIVGGIYFNRLFFMERL